MGGSTEYYSYDDGDKLQSVTVGGTAVKTFGYDAAGRTTSVVSSSGTTTLSYDAEGRSGTTKDLSHSLKSVDSQTTTSQSVAASRVYDAFGNVASSTGTFVGPFGYRGGFGCQEEATGLKLLGHRMYDSSTGRFLTRDPIKDGRNWYVYCENDPVGFDDRSGLSRKGKPKPAIQVVKEVIEPVRRIGKIGLKIVFVVPVLVELGIAINHADQEARLYRQYKQDVSEAMDSGLDPETGQNMIKENNPGYDGPLGVIRKFWERLIEIA